MPLVYDEMRKLAAARMASERPDRTLQATALVHEAYLRLVDVEQAQHWNSRGHFFSAAMSSDHCTRSRLLRLGNVIGIPISNCERRFG